MRLMTRRVLSIIPYRYMGLLQLSFEGFAILAVAAQVEIESNI